jgi:hypothetical protein
MKVIPVPFNRFAIPMLQMSQMLVQNGNLAIAPRKDKLILALKGAIAQDFRLDKDRTPHDDIFDSFRLCCRAINEVITPTATAAATRFAHDNNSNDTTARNVRPKRRILW